MRSIYGRTWRCKWQRNNNETYGSTPAKGSVPAYLYGYIKYTNATNQRASDIYQPRIKLFVFYDSDNSKLRMKECGKSFSDNDFENMNKERGRFLKAFERSIISHKKLFDLSDYLGDFKDEPNRINVEVILSLLQEV